MVASGMMTDANFFLYLRKSILDYEIRNNAIGNSLTGQKNAIRKEEMAARDPKLMVSTVHGVKGMEFDHVVVVLQPETSNSRKDESYKRLPVRGTDSGQDGRGHPRGCFYRKASDRDRLRSCGRRSASKRGRTQSLRVMTRSALWRSLRRTWSQVMSSIRSMRSASRSV